MTAPTHRAREHMLTLARLCPGLWVMVDQVRESHSGRGAWPDYCYLPLEHAGVVAAAQVRVSGGQIGAAAFASLASEIATLSAWRMTQGIYRYDPALYPALVDTPLDGALPASIIRRLPEWCVYIETPGLTVPTTGGEMQLLGTYAWVDRPQAGDHDILILLLDAAGTHLTVSHVPLIGTMPEALASVAREWRAAYARGNSPSMPPESFEALALKTLTPLVSLVLYLCTEEPDISGKGTPGNPQPVKTRRRGTRLFAAEAPSVWDVGVRMGAALRAAYQRQEMGEEEGENGSPTGRRVRPHVRRAHWHTYISGPRNAPERPRSLKWLPPIAVNLDDAGDLPAVIRRVEK